MRAAVLVIAALLTSGQQATVGEALDRLDGYWKKYESELSAVVADEELIRETDGRVTRKLSRRLRSEIALLRLPGNLEWLGFRSVRTVDGITRSPHHQITRSPDVQAVAWACGSCRTSRSTWPSRIAITRCA
ncbi:MAG TPA: hypothetical protein VFP85_10650 [Vicinamibacterales bacterium]|nr:hypothetical protein [Vicinamibacterales bacterium]